MAKKKIVVNEGKKKKKHGCCTCVLVAFIVFLVILGAGVGVGWYFGDKYTKQYIGMSLKDCFGVVRDLTHAKEKKIVEKGYGGTSPEEFENQLKKQLFLNENADLNKDTLMEQITGSGEAKQSALLSRALLESGVDTDDETENDGTTGGDGDNAIMNYVASLFTRENMDIDALEKYDEEEHGDYILNFTDVQLAAFLADAVKVGLSSEAVAESGALASIGDIIGDTPLSDVLYFDQVVFYGTQENPHIKLTLSLDIRLVANGYVSNATGMNLNFFIKLFLPKRIFLTADVSMGGDGALNLYINQMNDAKMDRFYKLVNGLSNIGGGEEKDIRETINDGAEKVVGGIAKAVKEYGDVSEIGNGKIKIDLLQAMIGVSGMNEGKEEAQALTSPDIIYALKYVVTSDFENAIDKDHTWQNRYYENGDKNTVPVYKKAENVNDRDDLADYEEALLKELEKKYLIKRTDNDGNERSFADLMRLFGIGGDSDGKTLLDWIDADKLGELAASKDNINVVITDEMLGAIFNAEIGSIVSGGGTIADMNPQVYSVHIEKRGEKTFMHAGIAVKAESVLGGAGALGEMISGIFGDNMMLSFVMEITPTSDPDYAYEKTTLALNDLTQDEMDRFINIMSKLGLDFSADELGGQIETPMRDALKNMESQMPGMTFAESALNMPNLFDITVDKMLTDDEGNVVKYAKTESGEKDTEITGDDLKAVMDSLYNYKAPETNIKDGDVSFDDITNSEAITEEQLGAYMRAAMKNQNMSFEANYFTNLISVEIKEGGNKGYIEFVVEVETAKLFKEGNCGDFDKFIKVDKVYAKITVDLNTLVPDSDPERYDTTSTINEMDQVRRRQFEAIVFKFNDKDSEVNMDVCSNEMGGIVYTLINGFTQGGRDIAVTDGKISKA